MEIGRGGNTVLTNGSVAIQFLGTQYRPELFALSLGASGRVCGAADVVAGKDFASATPNRSVALRGSAIEIDLAGIDPAIDRIVIAAVLPQGNFAGARLTTAVHDGPGRTYSLVVDDLRTENAMLLAEVYRHNGGWKVRNPGQGYNSGTHGLTADFGLPQIIPAAAHQFPVPQPAPAPNPLPGPGTPPGTPRQSHGQSVPRYLLSLTIWTALLLLVGWGAVSCQGEIYSDGPIKCGTEVMQAGDECRTTSGGGSTTKSMDEQRSVNNRLSWVGLIFFGALAVLFAWVVLRTLFAFLSGKRWDEFSPETEQNG
ncbi:TerD family protein [Nocardia huaxiensis]|uniref:TerD family protein n=1 Tax=Nocardia huaxiensis TaxID=2755382 RepID=UPI001E4E6569|nr:TerD family protein [Nocardia huaxiensis]UFS95632.1 TerD family protein [Nocardia huaxiensis]